MFVTHPTPAHPLTPARGTGAPKSCGLIDGYRYFCVIQGKPSILHKMYFSQVFWRAPWLMPAPNLVKGGDYGMLQQCEWIQTPTVKRCSKQWRKGAKAWRSEAETHSSLQKFKQDSLSPIGAARSKFSDCVLIADCRIRRHTRLE